MTYRTDRDAVASYAAVGLAVFAIAVLAAAIVIMFLVGIA